MTFLDFIIFLLDVILGHTPLMIVLLHTKRSDFAFIWIRCSDFICITFASTVVRPSNFVFCISGVQISPSYG